MSQEAQRTVAIAVIAIFVGIIGILAYVSGYRDRRSEESLESFLMVETSELSREEIASFIFPARQRVLVPSWRWVEQLNLDGMTCGIEYGGELVELRRHDGQVEVVYYTLQETYGTKCPAGSRFFLPEAEFERMTSDWLSVVEAETAHQLWVASILANPAENRLVVENQYAGWVRVENPSVLRETQCRLNPGGTLTEVGRSGGFILLEYSTTADTFGTPCDNGTLISWPVETVTELGE